MKKPYDKRTREQKKADDSALIAWTCFVAAGALLLGSLLVLDVGGSELPEEAPEETAAEEVYDPAWDKPATESAVYDGPIVYYEISAKDRRILECVVQGEAGGESLEGKMWVATCLLNAMKREGNASAEYVRVQYQYAGWSESINDDTVRAVSRVFDDGEVMHDSVLWFYAPKYCNGKWHEKQEFVSEIGGHRFFCPKEGE